MLVLVETPVGYAIFKLLDESKLRVVENIWEEFSTTKASEILQLVDFKGYKNVDEAVQNVVAQQEGRLGKALKKILKKQAESQEELAVGDAKLGSLIKETMDVKCISGTAISEVMRAIRANMDNLLADHKDEMNMMRLAVSHSLSRYKVKFNPEKIDTMIVQAVSLLDDLDKELNNYAMRCREWYGWHFPELSKLIPEHQTYARVLKAMGLKQNAAKADFSGILPDELAERVKQEAEISMGTDISELDLLVMLQLCNEIIEMSQYRVQLHDYLKNRMYALAPNLTILLGELVGARLISKAGSLIQLAKQPASTVQILGAEKALFRAIKTKKDTPKYGIIYHAQLITQSGTRMKGRMARKLAAKVALSTRFDALAEGDESASSDFGIQNRAYLEKVAKEELEALAKPSSAKQSASSSHGQFKRGVKEYDVGADSSFKKREMRGRDSAGGPGVKRFRAAEEVGQESARPSPAEGKKHGKEKLGGKPGPSEDVEMAEAEEEEEQ